MLKPMTLAGSNAVAGARSAKVMTTCFQSAVSVMVLAGFLNAQAAALEAQSPAGVLSAGCVSAETIWNLRVLSVPAVPLIQNDMPLKAEMSTQLPLTGSTRPKPK